MARSRRRRLARLPGWVLLRSRAAGSLGTHWLGYACALGSCSVLLWLAPACARFERAKECALLIDTVNASLKQITEESKVDDAKATAIAHDSSVLALRYEKLAEDVRALALTDEELRVFADRYYKLALEAAQALRSVTEARSRRDFPAADRERKAYDSRAQEEAPLVQELNRYCSR